MTARGCCVCGAPIVRRMLEPKWRFEERQVCSKKCNLARCRAKGVANAALKKRLRSAAQKAAKAGHNNLFLGTKTAYLDSAGTLIRVEPPKPGTTFADPAEWLKHNSVTRCPTRYATTVIGAGL